MSVKFIIKIYNNKTQNALGYVEFLWNNLPHRKSYDLWPYQHQQRILGSRERNLRWRKLQQIRWNRSSFLNFVFSCLVKSLQSFETAWIRRRFAANVMRDWKSLVYILVGKFIKTHVPLHKECLSALFAYLQYCLQRL